MKHDRNIFSRIIVPATTKGVRIKNKIVTAISVTVGIVVGAIVSEKTTTVLKNAAKALIASTGVFGKIRAFFI